MKVVMANGSNGTGTNLRKFLLDNVVAVDYEDFSPKRERYHTFDPDRKTRYNGCISVVAQHARKYVTCYVRYDGKHIGYLTFNNVNHQTIDEAESRRDMDEEEIAQEKARISGYKYWIGGKCISKGYGNKAEPAKILVKECVTQINGLEGSLQKDLQRQGTSQFK